MSAGTPRRARGGPATSSLSRIRIVSTAAGHPHWGGVFHVFDQFVNPFLGRFGLEVGETKVDRGPGSPSDHDTENVLAYAVDYPTTSGEAAARQLATAMGFSAWAVDSYETFIREIAGISIRWQILWGAAIDHGDHIHVGGQRVS